MKETRPFKTFLIKHKPTGVLMRRPMYDPPTPAELKLINTTIGEPVHVLRKGKIQAKKRRQGIWQYDPDDKDRIYFTCPWCGSIGLTYAAVDQPSHESIWCGAQGIEHKPTNTKSCGRHLSLIYHTDPKPGLFYKEDGNGHH